MPASRAKILNSKIVYTGRVFGVRHDEVIEPGGVRATRDVVTHHGSVVLLPVVRGGVLLVRQYRHSIGQFLWEVVAGRIEPGESVISAARRELLEETGYTARRLRKMLDAFPTPGFVSERMTIFLAEDLTAGAARPDEDERIEPRAFSWAEIDRLLRRGKLQDAKSIVALLYYDRYIRRGRSRHSR